MHNNSNNVILSICDIHPLRYGSFECFLYELSKSLEVNGFKHVIVFRGNPIKSVNTALLSTNSEILIFSPSKHSIFDFFKLFRLVKDYNPKIIHFHFYPPYSILNFIKYIKNTTFLYTDHMGINPTNNYCKKLIRKIYHYSNFLLFNNPIDSIICVSEVIKSKYLKEYGIKSDKLIVIYNGIDTSRFSYEENQFCAKTKYATTEEIIVSCIAGLRIDKGVQCLIKAAPIIIEKIPNVKLLIVGDGDYKKKLEELTSNLNLKEKIMFTGFKDSTEEIYSISSCIAIPSLSDESFCFVAAEAISMGISVVAFDSGAITELFGKIKTVKIIPQNHEVLGNSIVDILLNLPTDTVLKEGSKVINDNYSVNECVNRHINLYKYYTNKN
ncbi:glycosyltransferase family 4 protein [Methanolobus mangrovi]|uniref:Glycosyltransferase family 4 protein n=1 Tax=Methanolobus mangrovi TaxID=3072977 RepID=A0AA51UJH5_9EURY|nr:glycosyltransferase family 4 protein [Methanolobus mangrovi]WMW23242.1 glycosyltransferase family 4 protein [Methanolobus mangrovi]